MTIFVYQTAGHYSRSILCARLVAEIETDSLPEDEQAFADQCDGDFIETKNETSADEEAKSESTEDSSRRNQKQVDMQTSNVSP